MEHRDYQELVTAYALDALDPSEERALTEHLELCSECRAELTQMRDTAASLATAAPAAVPGDHVRQQILQRIRSESRPAQARPAVVPLKQSFGAWTTVLRLAAAVAFVALLLGIIILWRRDAAARKELARLSNQVGAQQQELQSEHERLAHQGEALRLLTSPEAKTMALAGTNAVQSARASFVYDQRSGQGILMIEGLPPTPADKAYEVWFIPKGQSPIPGPTFTVSDGQALVSHTLPSEARSPAVVAVTLEPKGGSEAPTGPVYLASPAS
jgi:anti-sigma-K factor RskA